ncbi:hypothetical protein DIPPA_58092 [Diplonema papillatum]|nr:hypothetical protein DIPPA_58092 [Diplonema papillatum]
MSLITDFDEQARSLKEHYVFWELTDLKRKAIREELEAEKRLTGETANLILKLDLHFNRTVARQNKAEFGIVAGAKTHIINIDLSVKDYPREMYSLLRYISLGVRIYLCELYTCKCDITLAGNNFCFEVQNTLQIEEMRSLLDSIMSDLTKEAEKFVTFLSENGYGTQTVNYDNTEINRPENLKLLEVRTKIDEQDWTFFESKNIGIASHSIEEGGRHGKIFLYGETDSVAEFRAGLSNKDYILWSNLFYVPSIIEEVNTVNTVKTNTNTTVDTSSSVASTVVYGTRSNVEDVLKRIDVKVTGWLQEFKDNRKSATFLKDTANTAVVALCLDDVHIKNENGTLRSDNKLCKEFVVWSWVPEAFKRVSVENFNEIAKLIGGNPEDDIENLAGYRKKVVDRCRIFVPEELEFVKRQKRKTESLLTPEPLELWNYKQTKISKDGSKGKGNEQKGKGNEQKGKGNEQKKPKGKDGQKQKPKPKQNSKRK